MLRSDRNPFYLIPSRPKKPFFQQADLVIVFIDKLGKSRHPGESRIGVRDRHRGPGNL